MKKISKHFIWFCVAILPLISYALGYIVLSDTAMSMVPFNTFMLDNFGLTTSNFVFGLFTQFFGEGGYLPIFTTDSGILYYVTYFITIQLVHIVVDALLLLPNIVKKLFAKVGDYE